MPRTRKVELTAEARAELEQVVRHDARPYVRERAAAVLKVADGTSALQVALHGLLRTWDVDAVYRWLDRYAEAGIAGLSVRPGRGRKPAFSPSGTKR